MTVSKGNQRVSRGTALWNAPRMKGVVKNLGIKNTKRPKKAEKQKHALHPAKSK